MALTSQQQQQLQQTLVSRGGYNPADAANAASNLGGRAEELYREFVGDIPTSVNITSNIGGGGGDVGGFQSAVSQVSSLFQEPLNKQVSSLEDRYKSIIDEIKGVGARQEERQRAATAEELARRGIDLQGGLGQQQLTSSTQPIAEQTQMQLRGAGADLASAISQLQAGYNTNAINAALQLVGAGDAMSTPLSIQKIGERGYAIDPYTGEVINTFGGGGGVGSGGLPLRSIDEIIADTERQLMGSTSTQQTSPYGMSTLQGPVYFNF